MQPGAAAAFSVDASGATTYRWQRSNDGGATFANIAGATSASYTLANAVAVDNNARFRVVVGNVYGDTTSAAAQLVVGVPPARVTAGLSVAAARLANGTLLSWGTEFFGELGNGGSLTAVRSVPGSLATSTSIARVSSGAQHSIAVAGNGTAFGWGFNTNGQLGDQTSNNAGAPVRVFGVTTAVSACAGGSHSLVLLGNGSIVGMGDNSSGELGLGSAGSFATAPTPVVGISTATAVACGSTHSLALLSDGTVRAWGRNNRGQLGDGGATNQPTPVAVSGLTQVVAIAAGFDHSLALRSDGTVWSWGHNARGQLGDGATANRSTPFAVPLAGGVMRIAAGGQNSMALRGDGVPFVWGNNLFGQLATGSLMPALNGTPAPVPGLSNIVDVVVGHHPDRTVLFAVRGDGTVAGWGNNTQGQVGNGSSNSPIMSPATVTGVNVN